MERFSFCSTLQALNLIRYYEGQHIIDISNLPERLKTPREFKVVVDPSKLHWTPLHTGAYCIGPTVCPYVVSVWHVLC